MEISSGQRSADNKQLLPGGVLFVICADEEAKTWLLDKVPTLTPWEAASLRVDDAKKVVKTARVVVWVPTDFLESKDPTRILELLEIQNEGLSTEEWRVVGCRTEKNGLVLVLAMAEDSLKKLSQRGNKAYFGLTQVTFKPTAPPKDNAEAAGAPSKPAA